MSAGCASVPPNNLSRRPCGTCWVDGALAVVSGGDEQPFPDVEDGGRVEVVMRSKDTGGRLVTWVGRACVVRPEDEQWDADHRRAGRGAAQPSRPRIGRGHLGEDAAWCAASCRPASTSTSRQAPSISPLATWCTWPATWQRVAAATGRLDPAGQRRRPAHLDALGDVVATALRQQPRRDQRHAETGRRRAGRRVLGNPASGHEHPRVDGQSGRVPGHRVHVERVQQVVDLTERRQPRRQLVPERPARGHRPDAPPPRSPAGARRTGRSRRPRPGPPRSESVEADEPQQVARQRCRRAARPGRAASRPARRASPLEADPDPAGTADLHALARR